MRVEHGQYTVNGCPVGKRTLTIKFDMGDEFVAELLRLVEVGILDGGGDPDTLRHVEVEVRFLQDAASKYTPVLARLKADHG